MNIRLCYIGLRVSEHGLHVHGDVTRKCRLVTGSIEWTGQNMHSFESKTHSFIVKIWLEEIADPTDHTRWRGHITHVPDGARRYLESVNEIPGFISPYLKADDDKINLLARLKQWLNP